MMAQIPKTSSNTEYLSLKEQVSNPILQTPIRKSFSHYIPKSIDSNDSSKSHQFTGYKRSNERENENLQFKESINSIKSEESVKSENSSNASESDENDLYKKEKTFKVILDSSQADIIQKNKKLAEIVLREKLKNDFFGGKSNLSLEEMIKVIKRATIIAGLYKEKPESTNDCTSCTQSSAISAIQVKESNDNVVQTSQML